MTGMTLTSVAVTPANPSIALGFNQVFVATGTFSDGSTQNITSQAVWATSNPAVASITDDPIGAGLATAGVAGTTTITARVDSSTGIPLTAGAVSGSTTLTVNAATLIAISVLPQNSTQLEGSTRAYSAIGVFSDGSTQNITAQVDWSSSDPAVVRVSTTGTTRGAGTASGPGSATVSAQAANGVTGTSAVQVLGNSTSLVSIAVAPDPATVGVGNVIALKATGAFTDGSTADITAAVTWSSAAPGIAVVSNATGANGTVTGLQAGATTVTATAANSSISATIPLTVSATAIEALYIAPPAVSIPFNAHRQYVATAVFNDGSSHDFMTEVTWSSSTGTVAAISNAAGSQGLVTPSGPGSTTITAVVPGTSISATTPLTVTNPAAIAMDIMPTSAAVALGTTKSFHAFVTFADGSRTEMTSQVTWNSAQPDVLSVVSGGAGAGTATGVSSGTATLSAALPGTAISASTSIAVSNAQILLVATTTTGASGTPSNLSSYLIDPATGALELVQTAQMSGSANSSFGIAISFPTMIACISSDRANAVYSFKIGKTGQLTPGSGSPATVASNAGQEDGPYGAVFDASGAFVYTAIFSGAVAGFSVNPSTAALSPLPLSPFAAPSPNPYGAQLRLSPNESFLYAIEYGAPGAAVTLNTFALNPVAGTLSPISGVTMPGMGMLYLHHSAPFAFFVNNAGNIQSYSISSTGAVAPLSLPPTPVFGSFQYLMSAIDPLGRFLYVASYGQQIVAVFAVNAASGAVTPVSGSPFGVGLTPGGLATSPHGEFLYVVDANGWNLLVFRMDTVTGRILGQVKTSPYRLANSVARDLASLQLPPP